MIGYWAGTTEEEGMREVQGLSARDRRIARHAMHSLALEAKRCENRGDYVGASLRYEDCLICARMSGCAEGVEREYSDHVTRCRGKAASLFAVDDYSPDVSAPGLSLIHI